MKYLISNILSGKVCVIGDGKANFVHGILDIRNIKKIYSINLPQALQDYLIIKKYNSIDCKLIKVVNNSEDLLDKNCKLFLIPAEKKDLPKSQKINLFVNMLYFQEMPLSKLISILVAKSNSSYLYSLNREEKIMADGIKLIIMITD